MMRIAAGFVAGLLVASVPAFAHRSAYATDGFVRFFEQWAGVTQGETKTIPQCGCTLLYRGTEIHGFDYDVHLRKLD